MKQYQHLTREERYTIERMSKEGYKQQAIAECLNRSESTVSRELMRNRGCRGYRYKQADEKARLRRFESRKRIKFTDDLQGKVERHLREDWSPEQVSGHLIKTGQETVSHERIYQHVYRDHRHGGTLYRHLRHQRKKRRKRLGRRDRRGRIANRVSIDERPASVDQRLFYGDWEADLVMGKNHEGAVLTLVERKGKYCLIHPLENKRGNEVALAMIAALQPFRSKIRSITVDNGKEFSGHEMVAECLETKVYFAHPYASWERGLSENTNGLIRQYLPKEMSLKGLTLDRCRMIEKKLNSRPRKRLGFNSPDDFLGKIVVTSSS